MRSITILEALTSANPTLREHEPKSKKNTSNEDFLNLDVSEIAQWNHFTYENLYPAFADILWAKVELKELAMSDNDSQADIQNEDGVDYVMNVYTTRILRAPLKIAAGMLQARHKLPAADISFHGRSAGIKMANPSAPTDDRRAFKPDWTIHQNVSKRCLVMGDSKLSGKWQSSDLGNYRYMSAAQIKNLLLPFRQIATYCYLQNTRFGFIVTPKELVVTALLIDASHRPNVRANLLYRSVSWIAFDQGQMTVNLALWFLTAIALNPRYLDARKWLPHLGLFHGTPELGADRYYHPISNIMVSAEKSSLRAVVNSAGARQGWVFKLPPRYTIYSGPETFRPVLRPGEKPAAESGADTEEEEVDWSTITSDMESEPEQPAPRRRRLRR